MPTRQRRETQGRSADARRGDRSRRFGGFAYPDPNDFGTIRRSRAGQVYDRQLRHHRRGDASNSWARRACKAVSLMHTTKAVWPIVKRAPTATDTRHRPGSLMRSGTSGGTARAGIAPWRSSGRWTWRLGHAPERTAGKPLHDLLGGLKTTACSPTPRPCQQGRASAAAWPTRSKAFSRRGFATKHGLRQEGPVEHTAAIRTRGRVLVKALSETCGDGRRRS